MLGHVGHKFYPLFAGILATLSGAVPLDEMSLSSLEQRLQEIDEQLWQLANYNLGGGIGAIGFRSPSYDTATQAEWIEIELGAQVPLDQVVLVPAIRRDGIIGFQADGFPEAFRLLAGTGDSRTGKVVAEFTGADGLLPRIAPVVIPCHGIQATWIRIEATTLSRREFDLRYVFQLSEVLAFSGEENVALHKPVTFPANHWENPAPGWPDSAVVDGFLPYLMAAAGGEKSIAYICSPDASEPPTLTIDLGTTHTISRVHLHAVDQSDTVPQAYTGDIGIPKVLRIEGANEPDFSDAELLTELHHDTPYDVGPILMRTFPGKACRYVRLIAVQLKFDPLYEQFPARLGFAEIELFSHGRNVAINKPVSGDFVPQESYRSLSSLTDGRNIYGTILPLRDWLNQLALRHELEREHPVIRSELNERYLQQKANVARLSGLAAVLALGVIGVVIIDRVRRKRAILQTRKRIAADLHDELGADLHALGLLSDLAQSARSAPDRLGDLLKRIRSLSERTGKAARRCTNMLEADDLHDDLANDMRHTSDRILADLEHEIEIEGEARLRGLSQRKRTDLLLFFQESLINIIRHSGATRVHTRVTATDGLVQLTVADNGRGINGRVPASLRRRARLLGADVEIGSSRSSGAVIVLHLKNRWQSLLR